VRVVKLVEQIDDSGRWWRVGAIEVDLNSTTSYPTNVRACALAHRDGTDDEGQNIAAILDAQVETGDQEPLPLVSGWLFGQSQRLHRGIVEQIEVLRRAA
jgi:hypothetical protein